MSCYRALVVAYPYDRAAGGEVVRKLRGLPVDRIREWLEEMPLDWLSNAMKSEICRWWVNDSQRRLDETERGLASGTYL